MKCKYSVKSAIKTAVSNERLNSNSNENNVHIVPRYVLVISHSDVTDSVPFPREPIACIDCESDLSKRTDWEPITHRGVHAAMCTPCIALRYEACENPVLEYARVQNTHVVDTLFPDGPVVLDNAETSGYRVLSADDIAEYYAREDIETEPIEVL